MTNLPYLNKTKRKGNENIELIIIIVPKLKKKKKFIANKLLKN